MSSISPSIQSVRQTQTIQSIQPKIPTLVEQSQKGNDNIALDRSVISTLKGTGSGALAASLPTVPIAIYLLKTAGGGTGGIGQASAGLGLAAAGVLGGVIGGAVAVNTTDSNWKGALIGGGAAALVGAAVTGILLKSTIPTGGAMNILPAMRMAAVAFGVTGAIGGGMGATFAHQAQQ